MGAALVREAARRPLVAILVDLDNFKPVNDALGHRAGDEALITVGDPLAAAGGCRLGSSEGYGLVGGIGEYEGAWWMAYVREAEGIIVSRAERIG